MLSLPGIAKRLTYGFRLAKMNLDFPHHPEWEVTPKPEINGILQQPFRFLGKGAQCYVFESNDGKYVIKLFRYNQPSTVDKILTLFNACKIAYDFLPHETGLIYLHLNPTPMHLPVLKCKDAVGRSYRFPLDRCRFALQVKAESFRSALQTAKMNPVEMQRRIDQFLSLLQARAAKGIINTDPNLSRNFGFLEDRAIEFDFGNYRLNMDLDRRLEVMRYTSKLRRWLTKQAPEWVDYLDKQVESIL